MCMLRGRGGDKGGGLGMVKFFLLFSDTSENIGVDYEED